MKILWLSDVHLNFLSVARQSCALEQFYNALKGDAIIISGDIGESHNVCSIVRKMETYTGLPVYFVLGNHDFYGATTEEVKAKVKKLNWIPKQSRFELTKDTALIGVDGWGDCRNGDFEGSRLRMSDWVYILDVREAFEQDTLKQKLQELADKDARLLKRRAKAAIKAGYKRIILVTHVPPFEEACLYAGRKSTPGGLPFFSSQILGTELLPVAEANPNVEFIWLSGHTHSRCTYKPCENMTVKVAEAEYFKPQVEEEIEL